jgi:hypothetical protein
MTDFAFIRIFFFLINPPPWFFFFFFVFVFFEDICFILKIGFLEHDDSLIGFFSSDGGRGGTGRGHGSPNFLKKKNTYIFPPSLRYNFFFFFFTALENSRMP